MSGRGKRKEGEEETYSSEDGGEGKHPPKKASKTEASKADSDDDDGSDDIVVCEISKNRRVSVRNWRGKVWVDIREFYVKDGMPLPGKKGISLSLDQWNILRDHVETIDKALGEYS